MNAKNPSHTRSRSRPSRKMKADGRKSRKNHVTSERRSPSDRNGDWMDALQIDASSLEKSVTRIIARNPIASLAVAAGAGLLAHFVLRKITDESETESPEANVTRFSEGISRAISGFQGEIGSLTQRSFADVREDLVDRISGELSERPIDVLATAAGIGFGLANLSGEDLKQIALRFAKTLAVQSIDHFSVAPQPSIEARH